MQFIHAEREDDLGLIQISSNRRTFWYVLALWSAGFLAVAISSSLNLPIADDFTDILDFLLAFRSVDSLDELIAAFLEPQAEHRTAASRLIYLITFKLFGEANFRIISAIPNLASIILIWIMLTQSKPGIVRNTAALAIVLCMLQPRAYHLMVWSTAGMHYCMTFLYAGLAFHFIERCDKTSLPLASLSAVLASFTATGGLLVWPVSVAQLIWQKKRAKRRSGYMILAGWLALGAVVTTIHRYNFHSITMPMLEYWELFLDSLQYSLLFYLALLGSAFGYGSPILSIILGVVLLTASFIALSKAWKQAKVMHWLLLFAHLFALAIAFGRAPASLLQLFGSTMGIDLAMTSRYALPSMIICAILSALVLESWVVSRPKAALMSLVVLTALHVGNWIYFSEELLNYKEEHKTQVLRYGIQLPLKSRDYTLDRLQQYREYEIYFPPPDSKID